jgi:hypothetical protein
VSTTKKLSAVVALLGLATIAAHAALGLAGSMTAEQWQSGVGIGLVVFILGGAWHRLSD